MQALSHQRGPEDCAGSGLRLPVRPPPLRGGAAPHRSPLLRGGAAVLLPQVLMGHVITLKLSIQEIEKKTHSRPLSDGRRVLSVTHGETPVIFCYFLFYLFNAFKKKYKTFHEVVVHLGCYLPSMVWCETSLELPRDILCFVIVK